MRGSRSIRIARPHGGFSRGILADRHHKCIGTIGEMFDAEEPFTPRGCVTQAWSVAEVLRAWVQDRTRRD